MPALIKTEVVTPNKIEKPARGKQAPWQFKKRKSEIRRLQRLRLNAKFKTVVKPKNATVALHEMYPNIVYQIDEVTNRYPSLYFVYFELNGKYYSGKGYSKNAAKTNACEKALKTILLKKMCEEKGKCGAFETDSYGNPVDEFPWGKLAGFALHKLMDSCINDHDEDIPSQQPPYNIIRQLNRNEPINVEKLQLGETRPEFLVKVFPDNPLEYDPFLLYNNTWPHVSPNYDIKPGDDGKPEHILTVSLEGYRFTAADKSKEEAEADFARAVISTLRDVKYPQNFKASVVKT